MTRDELLRDGLLSAPCTASMLLLPLCLCRDSDTGVSARTTESKEVRNNAALCKNVFRNVALSAPNGESDRGPPYSIVGTNALSTTFFPSPLPPEVSKKQENNSKSRMHTGSCKANYSNTRAHCPRGMQYQGGVPRALPTADGLTYLCVCTLR